MKEDGEWQLGHIVKGEVEDEQFPKVMVGLREPQPLSNYPKNCWKPKKTVDYDDVASVPADTEGQNLLEAAFWLGVMVFFSDVIVATLFFAYPFYESKHIQNLYDTNPSAYEKSYGSRDVDGLVTEVDEMVFFAACLVAFIAFFSIFGLFAKVIIATWYEIVQGFVQQGNAFFMVVSCILAFMSLFMVKYTTSLPDQVRTNAVDDTLVGFYFMFWLGTICSSFSFVGLLAAWTENRRLLMIYGITMLIVVSGPWCKCLVVPETPIRVWLTPVPPLRCWPGRGLFDHEHLYLYCGLRVRH